MIKRCTTCKHYSDLKCHLPIPAWVETLLPEAYKGKPGLVSYDPFTTFGADCKTWEWNHQAILVTADGVFKWENYRVPKAGEHFLVADGSCIICASSEVTTITERVIVKKIGDK